MLCPFSSHEFYRTVSQSISCPFQGQRVYNARFKLGLQNIDDLEDRIRAAEAKLGIAAGEGLPIKYERSTESLAGLFGTVLLLVMLGLLFAGGRNLRSR